MAMAPKLPVFVPWRAAEPPEGVRPVALDRAARTRLASGEGLDAARGLLGTERLGLLIPDPGLGHVSTDTLDAELDQHDRIVGRTHGQGCRGVAGIGGALEHETGRE